MDRSNLSRGVSAAAQFALVAVALLAAPITAAEAQIGRGSFGGGGGGFNRGGGGFGGFGGGGFRGPTPDVIGPGRIFDGPRVRPRIIEDDEVPPDRPRARRTREPSVKIGSDQSRPRHKVQKIVSESDAARVPPKGGKKKPDCRRGACRPSVVVRTPPYVPADTTVPPTSPSNVRTLTASPNQSAQSPRGPIRSIAPPPAGETRFVADQIVCVLRDGMSEAQITRFLHDNGLARTQSGRQRIALIGADVFRYRITDRRDVSAKVAALARDPRVFSAQPNYLYGLTQEAGGLVGTTPAGLPAPASPGPAAPATTQSAIQSSSPAQNTIDSGPAQYVIGKLQLRQAHEVTSGDRVLIAVIDSAIDTAHPELSGGIAKQIDVLNDTDRNPHAHGTAMAGAIIARAQLRGVAPAAQVIAVRAFSADARAGASGTSFHLAQAISRAMGEGARVINLSFAGPQDPLLQQTLQAAGARGAVLVAAAGNAGPQSAPLYPAAYPNVIAVTATDADDKIYNDANRGKYVALAAPGVDVLVPAPKAAYGVSTGTSVAAAHVSGVVALLLARNPALDPDAIRQILLRSARALGPKPDDVHGAGIANAYEAILALDPTRPASAAPAH